MNNHTSSSISRDLVFATNNPHKIAEIKLLLPNHLNILSLDEIGFNEDIPETEPTLEGNALLKAKSIFSRYHMDCFADDTGLEVMALDGKPGVHSARYAGLPADPVANTAKLLNALLNNTNRKARFRTVISLIFNSNIYSFEGTINGNISLYPRGTFGFGYDPVFIPDGYDCTFAEMSLTEKNRISHRSIAIMKLVHFLSQAD